MPNIDEKRRQVYRNAKRGRLVVASSSSKTAAEQKNLFWQRTCVSVTHTREKERIGGIFYPIHCSKVNRCRPSQDRPRRAGRRLAFLVRSLFALLRFVERLSGHQPKSNKLIMDVHISAEACILWENLQDAFSRNRRKETFHSEVQSRESRFRVAQLICILVASSVYSRQEPLGEKEGLWSIDNRHGARS